MMQLPGVRAMTQLESICLFTAGFHRTSDRHAFSTQSSEGYPLLATAVCPMICLFHHELFFVVCQSTQMHGIGSRMHWTCDAVMSTCMMQAKRCWMAPASVAAAAATSLVPFTSLLPMPIPFFRAVMRDLRPNMLPCLPVQSHPLASWPMQHVPCSDSMSSSLASLKMLPNQFTEHISGAEFVRPT